MTHYPYPQPMRQFIEKLSDAIRGDSISDLSFLLEFGQPCDMQGRSIAVRDYFRSVQGTKWLNDALLSHSKEVVEFLVTNRLVNLELVGNYNTITHASDFWHAEFYPFYPDSINTPSGLDSEDRWNWRENGFIDPLSCAVIVFARAITKYATNRGDECVDPIKEFNSRLAEKNLISSMSSVKLILHYADSLYPTVFLPAAGTDGPEFLQLLLHMTKGQGKVTRDHLDAVYEAACWLGNFELAQYAQEQGGKFTGKMRPKKNLFVYLRPEKIQEFSAFIPTNLLTSRQKAEVRSIVETQPDIYRNIYGPDYKALFQKHMGISFEGSKLLLPSPAGQ